MSKRNQKAEKKRCGLFITRMVGIATFLSLRGKKVTQCITFLLVNYNDHKFSGLRQTDLLFHNFCRLEVQAWHDLTWSSAQGQRRGSHSTFLLWCLLEQCYQGATTLPDSQSLHIQGEGLYKVCTPVVLILGTILEFCPTHPGIWIFQFLSSILASWALWLVSNSLIAKCCNSLNESKNSI